MEHLGDPQPYRLTRLKAIQYQQTHHDLGATAGLSCSGSSRALRAISQWHPHTLSILRNQITQCALAKKRLYAFK